MSPSSNSNRPGELREKRIAQCYEHGIRISDRDKNYDYAHELLAECVLYAPNNLTYVEAMLRNLRAKFPHAAKRNLFGTGIGRSLRQAAESKEWRTVIRLGVQSLKADPWNAAILRSIAQACAHLHFNEVELAYLKQALEASPKDPQVNRHCALSLGRMGQFDQAIACWHRIEMIRPGDREAARMIDQLGQEKLKYPGGKPPILAKQYESHPETSTQAVAESNTEQLIDLELSPRQKLERAIGADPRTAGNYVELALLLITSKQYQEAEAALMRGIANCGELIELRECLIEVRAARSQDEVAVAESRRKELERRHRSIRVPWLEITLALAVISLLLQLFPPVAALTWRLVDIRRWSRASWLVVNLLVLGILFAARFLYSSDRRRRNRRILRNGNA